MDNEYEWGDWIDNDDPKDGMYIQVKFEDFAGRMFLHEGVVCNSDDIGFDMIPSPDVWAVEWIEWRERKPRSKAMDILRALVNDPYTPINAPTGPLRELTPA